MDLSVLYRDAQSLNARIYPYEIGFAGAATIEVAGRYGIFVDFDCLGSLQEFKAALAHELGHCATGCTHRVSSPRPGQPTRIQGGPLGHPAVPAL